MKYILSICLALFCLPVIADAQSIKGLVLEYNSDSKQKDKKTQALPFANVYWLATLHGTTTDDNGRFELPKKPEDGHRLVVSFVGYTNDTIDIKPTDKDITIILSQNILLEEVQIIQRREGAYVSRLNAVKTEVISSVGLCQLACCNLAESFENSATVDVGYSDAVSGAKQIQMLGLSGLYSQLMYENMPYLRGLSAPYGLSYVPGSFMESIQISKGTSSVINGFEALSGQINVEYRKPQTADPLFVNLFLNSELKYEANVIGNIRVNERLGTTIFGHYSDFNRELDHLGHDGFMDMPRSRQINVVNRWSYDGDRYKNISSIAFISENRVGGQMGFKPGEHQMGTDVWGFTNRVNRAQVFTKNGYMFSESANIGTQVSATFLDMKSQYGLKRYDANEKNLYANIIYEKTFSKQHKLNAGGSYQYNNIDEFFNPLANDPNLNLSSLAKIEHIPGVYGQYSLTTEKFSLVAGLRYDYNSLYSQSLVTPRLHFKWAFTDLITLRGSAGKGYRSPNILAENIGLMASSRQMIIDPQLGMEEAWNYGLNYIHSFAIGSNQLLTVSLDAYRTSFVKQLIVDLDRSASQASFFMSNKRSFSTSLQAEVKLDVLEDYWTTTLAARYNDVKYTLNDKLVEKPYVSKYKFLWVNNFKTNMSKWMLDVTFQYNGKMRLPNTNGARPEYSETYPMLHAQLTKRFRFIDVYLGCENILNTVQHDPIIGADNPFGPTFDSTVIWGSLMVRTFYIGLRLTL